MVITYSIAFSKYQNSYIELPILIQIIFILFAPFLSIYEIYGPFSHYETSLFIFSFLVNLFYLWILGSIIEYILYSNKKEKKKTKKECKNRFFRFLYEILPLLLLVLSIFHFYFFVLYIGVSLARLCKK